MIIELAMSFMLHYPVHKLSIEEWKDSERYDYPVHRDVSKEKCEADYNFTVFRYKGRYYVNLYKKEGKYYGCYINGT